MRKRTVIAPQTPTLREKTARGFAVEGGHCVYGKVTKTTATTTTVMLDTP